MVAAAAAADGDADGACGRCQQCQQEGTQERSPQGNSVVVSICLPVFRVRIS